MAGAFPFEVAVAVAVAFRVATVEVFVGATVDVLVEVDAPGFIIVSLSYEVNNTTSAARRATSPGSLVSTPLIAP
jgi:hypothetical protein